MKKILLCCFFFLLFGCKSYEYDFNISEGHYRDKLPNLELIYNHDLPKSRFGNMEQIPRDNSYAAYLFYNEAEKNLVNQHGEKVGYLILQQIRDEREITGWGWYILSGCTLLIPNIFGMPILSYTAHTNLKASIYDSKGTLLKQYFSETTDTEKQGLWWWYDAQSAQIKSQVESYKMGLLDLFAQIRNDISSLKQQLR